MGRTLKYLYGMSLELPSDWIDWTAYTFESQGAALRSVTFTLEPIPWNQVQAYLIDKGRAITQAIDTAKVGALHRYPNPEFAATGFDAELGRAEPKQHVALVLLGEDSRSLAASAKAVTGYAETFKQIVSSIRRDGLSATGARAALYRVYDYSFASPVPLRMPTQFAFATGDQVARISCEWSVTEPVFAGPLWSEAFVTPPEAVVRETGRQVAPVLGHIGTSGDGSVLPAPALEQLSASAVVSAPGFAGELFWAEARAVVGLRHFYIRFQSQSDAAAASALWRAILASIRLES